MWSLFTRTLRRSPAKPRRLEPDPPMSDADAWTQATRRREFEAMRAPLRDADMNLTLDTRLWLLRLPPKLRPVKLAESFPRVANRLARDWSDNFMLEVCFEDLMVDRRGGRRGFPVPVLREIRRLYSFNLCHRELIEQRMVRKVPIEDDLPVLHDAMLIEWEPTETIVVAAGSMQR